jgi:hypothetical protein
MRAVSLQLPEEIGGFTALENSPKRIRCAL